MIVVMQVISDYLLYTPEIQIGVKVIKENVEVTKIICFYNPMTSNNTNMEHNKQAETKDLCSWINKEKLTWD